MNSGHEVAAAVSVGRTVIFKECFGLITGSTETMKPKVGVQLSSFRHGPFEFEERIKLASDFGFEGVELIHFGPRPSPNPDHVSPEEAMEIMQRYQIEPIAAHLGSLTQTEQDFDQITRYLARLGTQNLVISFVGQEVDFSTRNANAWSEYGKRLKRLSNLCRDRGLFLGLHNHVLELLPVEGRAGLFRIFDEVDADELFWEADIGHIAASMTDFATLMTEYAERCKLLHVKDLSPEVKLNPVLEGDGHLGDFERLTAPVIKRIDWEVDLGNGVLDLGQTIGLARNAGTQWLICEIHKAGLDLAHAYRFLTSELAGQSDGHGPN